MGKPFLVPRYNSSATTVVENSSTDYVLEKIEIESNAIDTSATKRVQKKRKLILVYIWKILSLCLNL